MRLPVGLVSLIFWLGCVAPSHAEWVVISVDKLKQQMTVTVDGKREFVWPVSTGDIGYTTPLGIYRPISLKEKHFSKEWDDAPMPHSIFFTTSGHAIHGSENVKRLGHRASHGCVRLSPDNAATLFNLVQSAGMANTMVIIGGREDWSFDDTAY